VEAWSLTAPVVGDDTSSRVSPWLRRLARRGSGSAVYDLDAPDRVVDLYRIVLIEAASPQNLYPYLNERVLRPLWALLWLPA
jgi:hypothetical protein